MFILFKDTLFDRVAKRLDRLSRSTTPSAPSAFNFKDATAYVLGHANLADFRRNIAEVKKRGGKPSAWDEECRSTELANRRRDQAERLARYAAENAWALSDAASIVDAWQPTAHRPMHQVHPTDIVDTLRAEGEAAKIQDLLDELEDCGRLPTRDEVRRIALGLKCATGWHRDYLESCIGLLGVRLVNQRTGDSSGMGMDLLEMLDEDTAMPFVKASVAKALFQGWGRPKDACRARSLCDRVLQDLADGEIFSSDPGRIEFFWLAGHIYFEGSRDGDPLKAFHCLRRAADLGHGKAALRVCWYFSPPHPDAEPDAYTGVVPIDQQAAMHYFQIAIAGGYNTRTKTFREDGEA